MLADMSYRVVAFDIDGTLLTSTGRVLDSTLAGIAAIQASGGQVVLASGRTPASLRFVAEDAGLDLSAVILVGANGAQLAEGNGRELLRRPLDLELGRELILAGRALGATMMILDNDVVLADDRSSPWPEPETAASRMRLEWWDDLTEVTTPTTKLLFVAEPDHLQQVAEQIRADFEGRATFAFSAPNYFEATALGVSKASTLRLFCEQLGVPMSQVMAFGDHGNDVEMIRTVGLGVAMGNAIDELKAVADLVTGTNDDGGIAQVLAQHFDLASAG